MATNLIRFTHAGLVRWGVVSGDRIAPLEGDYPTTGELVTRGEADWRTPRRPTLDLGDVVVLSPVTAPARLLCLGANYRRHMIESGMDPDEKPFNMFFEKSDAAINSPFGSVVRPPHVGLLDYEIELALVFKRSITGSLVVTDANLHEVVFGITIANDISARDVQLPQMQFFKGKSYRGFCPLGPHLTVLERDELRYLERLTLTLAVNGEVRQLDDTSNLVFKPAETITELSTFSDVSPGDVLLTGTPAGCALRVPPPFVRRLVQLLLPERAFWRTFARTQEKRRDYLQPGDVVHATIASVDRVVDLGEQRFTVASAMASPAAE